MSLQETFADVAALIPRYSWEIMDEEQRDDLMEKVVLPRYMETTADGVQLGPTAWGEMLGASPAAIKGRVQRLQASQKQAEGTGATSPEPEWKKADRRAAKQLLREADDATLGGIIASLPPERVEAVAAAAHEVQLGNIRKSAGPTAPPSLADEDYETVREAHAKIQGDSTLEMEELFTALSRVRVKGVEKLVANASSMKRREWAARLPDEIALLQLASDLCKTTKLEAVR